MKTPTVPRKPKTIITAAHYQRLHHALDDPDTQMLVETDIETGIFSRGPARLREA